MSISGVTIIKNGIKLGYPFIESILSILDICDEFIISEGFSDDGTDKILDSAFGNLDKVKIFRDEWPERTGGRAIAEITDIAVSRAACDWIYYIQADEVVHEDNLPLIRNIAASRKDFHSAAFSFLHFDGSWDHIVENPSYEWAIRMFRNGYDIRSHRDGWSFDGEVEPVLNCTQDCQPIFHYGWIFRENIKAKQENHARLYPENEKYQRAAKRPAPSEPPKPNYSGGHPKIVKPLMKVDKYSPFGM